MPQDPGWLVFFRAAGAFRSVGADRLRGHHPATCGCCQYGIGREVAADRKLTCRSNSMNDRRLWRGLFGWHTDCILRPGHSAICQSVRSPSSVQALRKDKILFHFDLGGSHGGKEHGF